MENIFGKKIFSIIMIGILIVLETMLSIVNWCNGDFNGGTLVLFIIMIGMLVLCGIGLWKNNKWLIVVSGVSMMSVLIYIMTTQNSGAIMEWQTGRLSTIGLASSILYGIAIGFFAGSLILLILRFFKIQKHLRQLNTIFSLCAALLLFIVIVMALSSVTKDPTMRPIEALFWAASDFFLFFFALLTTSIGYQLKFESQPVVNQ